MPPQWVEEIEQMPTPPSPVHREPQPPVPERFDPATLDRTVIAIPLLEKIQKEKELISGVRKRYPKEAEKFNCVILFEAEAGHDFVAIVKELQQLVDEALANAEPDVDRARHMIGKRFPGKKGVFAWLDARTVRRILNKQAIRQSRRVERPVVIERILPERFKVIIDLNLEFVGGRDKAREWVE